MKYSGHHIYFQEGEIQTVFASLSLASSRLWLGVERCWFGSSFAEPH